VNLLQTWLILGVPLVAISCYLFIGRSKTLARIGYVGLLLAVLVLVLVPEDGGQGAAISAGFVGALAFVFVATGRGTQVDDEFVEHHQDRRRFTTTSGADAGDRG
jgi:O-antigen/teichoic acid export membrane protein